MEILNMEQDYVLCPEYVENIFSSPLKKLSPEDLTK